MAIQPPQRFELDDLTHVEREARTIYAPGATPGDVLVVQSDHSLVAAPGGGSMPGAARWIGPFPFAFDDAGLADGAEFYMPMIGDFLVDALLISAPDPTVDLPWDGTTPQGDIGYADAADGDPAAGFFSQFIGSQVAVDMTQVAQQLFAHNATNATGAFGLAGASLAQVRLMSSFGITNGVPFLPYRFHTADPLSVWVSQDGNAHGADPGASQGVGAIYLCIATPDAP